MTRLKSEGEDDFLIIDVENNSGQRDDAHSENEAVDDDVNVPLLLDQCIEKKLQHKVKRENNLLFSFVFFGFCLIFLILFLFSLVISHLED
jgi:hypothetical protein